MDSAFTCKDLGEIRYFKGIEVSRNKKGTMLNQRNFVLDIIQQVGMKDWKPCEFPFPKGIKLFLDEGEKLDDLEIYRSIAGKLLYLNLTRPNISYSMQQLSQFMDNPRKPHLMVAIYVIRYLACIINWGLCHQTTSEITMSAFCDAD